VVLFVVILAFLVGRERAGADPGLARTATPVPQSAPPAAQSQPQQQQTPGIDPNADPNVDPNADPNDPFGQQTDPGTDPSTSGGSDDNFGNAVPDGSGGSTQDVDPPSTHVS
jgi:hypothetical protein